MTVVLDHLSWPTGLAVAAICRAWCAETADVIRASAWKWQVPLPNEGSPGMLLRALYRGIGLADLVRMRTASTFERFEEGLRVAVFGAVGQWANLPPLCVSRCPAEWEKLPEETWWLARKGTGHTWRFQRFYVDIGVPRHEMMQERWTLEVFVERFCLARTRATPQHLVPWQASVDYIVNVVFLGWQRTARLRVLRLRGGAWAGCGALNTHTCFSWRAQRLPETKLRRSRWKLET